MFPMSQISSSTVALKALLPYTSNIWRRNNIITNSSNSNTSSSNNITTNSIKSTPNTLWPTTSLLSLVVGRG